MRWNPILITAPAAEPVTLTELQAFLKIAGERRPAAFDQPRDDGGEGFQEPGPVAPTVALAGAGAGNVDNGAHRYLVTFITADGETQGGAVSAAVTVADKTVDGKVAVSVIPVGGSAVTARKLYRTIAGGSTYLFLATISDNSTTTYTDNTADSGLGAGAPSTNSTGDAILTALRLAARRFIENLLGRSLITQTWDLFMSDFPSSGILRLPRGPLQSVTSVNYTPDGGSEIAFASSNYVVDTHDDPPAILLKTGTYWPASVLQPGLSVRIRYITGYGLSGSAVPASILIALRQLVAHWYQNPEPLKLAALGIAPFHVRMLLEDDRARFVSP